ncbi:Uncharacterised protein [uncultured archaeon]|nr:Uncharacterised protein [uncultured archaeon]
MVEKTFDIETHGLDKDARYNIIKEWIGKIEPMKIRSNESSIAAIVLFWITLFVFGFLIALIIPIVWIIWDFIKKPTPVKILEDTPDFIKFKTGVIKNSYPTIVTVNNTDKISINYSVFGGQLFSGKIKERWNILTKDLESMIKSAAGVESVVQPPKIINLEKASIGEDKTSLSKIQKLFLMMMVFAVISWFLPNFTSISRLKTESASLIYLVSQSFIISIVLILNFILFLVIVYYTLKAPSRVKTRTGLTFIFMLSQILLFLFILYMLSLGISSIPLLSLVMNVSVDIGFYIGIIAPIVAFLIMLIELISLKLKKK